MAAPAPYRTKERRERDRVYRRRIALALAVSIAIHACALIVIERVAPELPIIRQVGYPGPTRILPELSIEREPGPEESQGAASAGPSGGEFYRVIAIEVVDWEVPSGEAIGEEAERAAADAEAEEEPLFVLDLSRPQPTSSLVAFEHFVLPVYPRSTMEKGLEGRVVVRTHVTAGGLVDDVAVVRSELDAAAEMEAVRAASQWRFWPIIVGGRAIPVVVETSIWFRFRDSERPRRPGGGGR
jgi:TonB family protein